MIPIDTTFHIPNCMEYVLDFSRFVCFSGDIKASVRIFAIKNINFQIKNIFNFRFVQENLVCSLNFYINKNDLTLKFPCKQDKIIRFDICLKILHLSLSFCHNKMHLTYLNSLQI